MNSAMLPERGFLPPRDPATQFVDFPELSMLDELGRELPTLLHRQNFRLYAESLVLPNWPLPDAPEHSLPELRLYYVRLGFLASGYINQVGHVTATRLPANIARPLCRTCALLNRPPILSYDGYALYNWKRLNPNGPIALGNIETLQNFVHLYDEHWFILVHVEIEAIAGQIVGAIQEIAGLLSTSDGGLNPGRQSALNTHLQHIGEALEQQIAVLKRIPERMDPALYYRTFRPYIRFFENVVYEGVEQQPLNFRGETGAQSSIMPSLIALMKIPHKRSILTDHLADMRRFMPTAHRAYIEWVESLPDIKPHADKAIFNTVLEKMATFREIHYTWAEQYINRHERDPRGTGGTPYMQWLKQLIDETRAHKG